MLRKILIVLVLMLAWTGKASAQGAFYRIGPFTQSGLAYVCPAPDGGTPCPSPSAIFSNVTLTTAISNPINMPQGATVSFYSAAGQYTIQFPASGYNQIVQIGGGGGISSVTSLPLTCTGTGSVSLSGVIYDCINGIYVTRTSSSNGVSGGGIWKKMGQIIYSNNQPNAGSDQGSSQEASALCEGSPQVLSGGQPMVCGPPGTAVTTSVLKLWWTCGFSAPNICYAESTDALTWFRKTTTVISGHARGRVFKNGSTYHNYVVPIPGETQIDHYTSPDGIVWTLSASAVIGLGSAGQWDSLKVANSRVWIEGATWYMLYEGIKTAGQWSVGIATSTDGAGNVWTKNGAVNPLCVGCGGPDKYKDPAGNYWVWTHSAPAGTSLPSDENRWLLTGLTTTPVFTASPVACVLCRTTFDEGWQSTGTGQLADVSHTEWNGSTLAFYEGDYDGGQATANIHVKVAIANIPWAAIVLTNEGTDTSYRAWDSSRGIGIGNPGIAPAAGTLSITNTAKSTGGYPALTVDYRTCSASTDSWFMGANTGVDQSAPCSTFVTNTSLTAARFTCNIATTNANGTCFLGVTNLSGVESLAYQTHFDGSGNLFNGVPLLASAGTAPTVTGTGACATRSTQTGGGNTGSFICTGTTGAATITITWTAAMTNGYNCEDTGDETTTADTLKQSSHTTTSCTLTAAAVATNDVIIFHAFGW